MRLSLVLRAAGTALFSLQDAMVNAAMSPLSPEKMLSAARPGVALPNPSGSHAIFSSSEYSFQDYKTTKRIHIVDLNSDVGAQVLSDAPDVSQSSPFWLDDETVGYFGTVEDKETKLYAKSIGKNDLKSKDYVVGEFPIDVENPVVHHGKLFITANVYPDSSLESTKDLDQQREKRNDTAMIFDSLWVRHWDHFVMDKRNSIYAIDLTQEDGKYTLSGHAENLLKKTGLESPVPPFGGAEDFSIGDKYLAFAAKDPALNPAWNTKVTIFLLDLTSSDSNPHPINADNPGASSHPVFSPSGRYLAYLEMRVPQYEADRNRVMIYDTVAKKTRGVTEHWDRSPSSVSWGADEQTLYLVAEEYGHSKIWELDLQSSSEPKVIVGKHSNTGVYKLRDGRLLFTQNSLTGPNKVLTLDGDKVTVHTSNPALDGTSLDAGEEFWFDGVNDRKVHGWVIRPPGMNANKKYPMAFLIHGGPQGAWTDAWSTRWNPNVFASAGFIVVAINPTGSTGYGQAFTDGIQGNWGGAPYQDLILGYQAAVSKFPEIHTDKAVALGASYGGYMINWIQGHPAFSHKFKALVCHDGLFSTPATWFTTDELYFPEKEFYGKPWDKESVYEKWNPARHVENWSTPMLVIHGAKDYRLGEAEGLAAFNTLQRLGVPSRFLYFPDENHWVLKAANSKVWHETVLDWITKWTTGDADGNGDVNSNGHANCNGLVNGNGQQNGHANGKHYHS